LPLLSLALLEVATALIPRGASLSFCPIGGSCSPPAARRARAGRRAGTLAAAIASAVLGPDRELARSLTHWD
jgi:hypothetical protein